MICLFYFEKHDKKHAKIHISNHSSLQYKNENNHGIIHGLQACSCFGSHTRWWKYGTNRVPFASNTRQNSYNHIILFNYQFINGHPFISLTSSSFSSSVLECRADSTAAATSFWIRAGRNWSLWRRTLALIVSVSNSLWTSNRSVSCERERECKKDKIVEEFYG